MAKPAFGEENSFSFSLLCQLPVSCWPNVSLVHIPNLNSLWAGLCYAQFEITQPLGLWALAEHGAQLLSLEYSDSILKNLLLKTH